MPKASITSDNLGRGWGLEVHFSYCIATLRIACKMTSTDVKHFRRIGQN